jgi:hypothetical protein
MHYALADFDMLSRVEPAAPSVLNALDPFPIRLAVVAYGDCCQWPGDSSQRLDSRQIGFEACETRDGYDGCRRDVYCSHGPTVISHASLACSEQAFNSYFWPPGEERGKKQPAKSWGLTGGEMTKSE